MTLLATLLLWFLSLTIQARMAPALGRSGPTSFRTAWTPVWRILPPLLGLALCLYDAPATAWLKWLGTFQIATISVALYRTLMNRFIIKAYSQM